MQTDLAPTPCANLRAKAMYVPTGLPATEDDGDQTAVCWCNRTLREIGPDDEPAEVAACGDIARVCYQTRAGQKRAT